MNNINKVIKALEGVSYLDWEKISLVVDEYFKREIGKSKKEIRLTDISNVIENLKQYYSSTI